MQAFTLLAGAVPEWPGGNFRPSERNGVPGALSRIGCCRNRRTATRWRNRREQMGATFCNRLAASKSGRGCGSFLLCGSFVTSGCRHFLPLLPRLLRSGEMHEQQARSEARCLSAKPVRTMTDLNHTSVSARDLLVGEHIDLIGAVREGWRWQRRAAAGFGVACFPIDGKVRQALCLQGTTCVMWKPTIELQEIPVVPMRVARARSVACPRTTPPGSFFLLAGSPHSGVTSV